VANKKQRDTAAADAEMKLKQSTLSDAAGNSAGASGREGQDSTDMLAREDEEDVIF